ncbi:MAG: hypothetical protein GY915_03130 [bacterium]|nr:hypothetical protein [bacterium]
MNKILLTFFLAGFSTATSQLWAGLENLEVSEGEFKQLPLPYKYTDLNGEEIRRLPLLAECLYTVLEGEEKIISGVHRPCPMIAIQDKNSGKTIVFHYHHRSNMESLVEIIREELGDVAPENLKGRIFTSKADEYNCDRYEGRTQLGVLKWIKDTLVEKFNIPDRKQIIAEMYDAQKYQKKYELESIEQEEYGRYYLADCHILIGTDLKPRCVSPIKEGWFMCREPRFQSTVDNLKETALLVEEAEIQALLSGAPFDYKRHHKYKSSSQVILNNDYNMLSFQIHFFGQGFSENQMNTPGAVPFMRLSELMN